VLKEESNLNYNYFKKVENSIKKKKIKKKLKKRTKMINLNRLFMIFTQN
jgi:hypothetical protein